MRNPTPARAGCWPRLLCIAAVVGLPVACSIVQPGDPAQEELDANRRVWLAAGIDRYRVNVQRICFCGFDVSRLIEVEVSARVVVAVRDSETGNPVAPELEELYPGVEGLFEVVQDALDRDAHRVTVLYDPTLGYPREISIDYLEFAIDEELMLNAEGLVPLR